MYMAGHISEKKFTCLLWINLSKSGKPSLQETKTNKDVFSKNGYNVPSANLTEKLIHRVASMELIKREKSSTISVQ